MKNVLKIVVGVMVVASALSFGVTGEQKETNMTPMLLATDAVDALPAYPCKAQAVTGTVKIKRSNGTKVRLTTGMTINKASSIVFARTSNKVLMIDNNYKTWWVLPQAYSTTPAVACSTNCTPIVQANMVNDTSSVILPVMFFHQ